MQENTKIEHPKTPFPHDTSHAHVFSQDVNAPPDYAQTYYVYMAHPTWLNHQSHQIPTSNLHIIKFTYYNDKFPQEATTRKLEKIQHTQQGLMFSPQDHHLWD